MLSEGTGKTDKRATVTQLLRAWSAGDPEALESLTPLVYTELRRMARRYMNQERSGHTLQATALVHEAFLRLADVKAVEWRDRAHFLAIAAQTMRRILVDFARSRNFQKRGAGVRPAPIEEALLVSSQKDQEITRLDDALQALAQLDPRKAKVVELRFFGGLEGKEIAEVLGVSTETISRDWKLAKAWLKREMGEAGEPGGSTSSA
jgi:RNA polymerase sigma factor (TIGR02999 family)